MATTLEELEIKFKASFGDLDAKMGQLKNQLNGLDKAANKTQAAFSGLGRMLKTLATVYAGRALFNVGKESLAMANEVVESENLFKESMGNMSKAAREWSDSLRDTLGLNAYTLRKNAGTMNVMLQSMGIGEKKAYDMSIALTELSEDMASFYNVNPQDMYAKLQSGMTGQSMPLKQIGILIDDHTLKQYAAAAGIKETTGELSQQEKVLARYAAIMAQTTASQGDLARTIDSPANQLRVLENNVNQAKVSLGKAAQTIQATLMPTLNRLASFALTAAQAIAYLSGGIGGLSGRNIAAELTTKKGAKATENLASKLKDAADGYKKAGGAARKAAKDANVGLKGFDEINKITEEQAKSGGGGGGGGGGGFDEFPPLDEANSFLDDLETVSAKVRELAEKIKAAFETLKPVLEGLALAFVTFKLTGNPAIALVVGVLGTGVSALIDYANRLKEARLAAAFGTIEIDLDEAATIVSKNLRTKTTDLLDAIEGLRADTDRALQRYSAAVAYTKKVTVTLQLMTMRTGYEQFMSTLAELKKRLLASSSEVRTTVTAYLDTLYKDGKIGKEEYQRRRGVMEARINALDALAENLHATVMAQVDAAMVDGDVDESKKETIRTTLETEADKLAKAWEALGVEMKAEVDADLKEGKITKEGAVAKKADIDAMVTEKVAELGIATTDIEAEIDTIHWTEKTLTPEQEDQLEDALQAEVDTARELFVTAKVQALAEYTTIVGENEETTTLDKIFDGVETAIANAEQEIKTLAAQAVTVGWTPELIAAATESMATLNEYMDMITSGGLTTGGAWAKAQHNLADLSEKSIKNFAIAYEEYLKRRIGELEDTTENSMNLLWSAFDKGEISKETLYAELDKLETGLAAHIEDITSGAVIDAAETMGPAIVSAIAKGLDPMDVYDKLEEITKTFADTKFDSLSENAKTAMREMLVPLVAELGPTGRVKELLAQAGVTIADLTGGMGEKALDSLINALNKGKITQDDFDMVLIDPTREAMERLVQSLIEGGDLATAGLIEQFLDESANVRSAAEGLATAGEEGFKTLSLVPIVSVKADEAKAALINETNPLKEIGVNLMDAHRSGFKSIDMFTPGKMAAQAAKDGAGSVSLEPDGVNLSQGLADGMDSNLGAVRAAATRLADAAAVTSRHTLEVKSPSRVFMRLGEMVVRGFTISLYDGIADVSSISERLSNAAIDGMAIDTSALDASPLSISSGSVSLEAGAGISGAIETGIARGVQSVMDALNVTLRVDGRELGRVAISNINQLQRSTGRMLLEF